MKYLTLLRHAKSSWEHAGLIDFDRPLNERGLRDAPAMGAYAGLQHFHGSQRCFAPSPDLVLTSPARRTLQTLELFLPGVGLSEQHVTKEGKLYLATAGALMKIVQNTPAQVTHLWLVGHNPGLEDLCAYVSPVHTKVSHFPTGALATFRFEVEDWLQVDRDSAVEMLFQKPRDLGEGKRGL